jgi:clan AA aspartic protease (TIGR02281 family)
MEECFDQIIERIITKADGMISVNVKTRNYTASEPQVTLGLPTYSLFTVSCKSPGGYIENEAHIRLPQPNPQPSHATEPGDKLWEAICLRRMVAPQQASKSNAIEVPLKEKGGIFVIPIQINGTLTLDLVLDSGATDVQIPQDVFSTLVRANTIAPDDFIGKRTYTLADGSTQEAPLFLVRELRVGNLMLRNVRASVGLASGELLLGESFLSRIAEWTLDNQRHVLKLSPKSQQVGTTASRPIGDLAPQPSSPAATLAVPVTRKTQGGERRFQITACGSIMDTASHLEWYVGADRDTTWPDADKWIKELRACNVNWTMPSISQLKTLFDRSSVAGTGYFTAGRYWPAHVDPAFSAIGSGSWVWAQGPGSRDKTPAFNFNQGIKVYISATNFRGTVRAFAVRRTR